MKNQLHQLSLGNYLKALARLQKNIRSGQFARFTQQKKWQIWNRLCRYARQLGIKIKGSIAAACMGAGLTFITPVNAQTFTQQTGTANPLDGVDVNFISIPTFVDIDADGDMDAFIGVDNGTVRFYENTGTAAAAVFAEQTGSANPFNGVDVGEYAVPAFVDIDGDGDMDAFIGEYNGTTRFYKNTGTTAAAVFAEQTGTSNPLDGVSVDLDAAPAFADIDGDGDMDVFIGAYDGFIRFYKNTGTTTAAVFAEQTGADDPLDGESFGNVAIPALADIDGDGDIDALVGSYDGTIRFYKNTGTTAAPVFTEQTGAANPFDGVNVDGGDSAPAFVDIDDDGDKDVFIGDYYGTISYYQNTSVLPLQLLSFSGGRYAGRNELHWQTAAEFNTKWFEIEMSSDGHHFTKIATVNAIGSGGNNYSANDKGIYDGKVFYRLKMVDIDDRLTYSQIIWIESALANGGVSIYPNPVKDVLNINIRNAKILKTNAGVFDVNGRLLQNILITGNQQQINVQPLAKGRYVIKFADGTAQSFIKK